MTKHSSVLVVSADETNATLSVNSDGVIRVLRTIYQGVPGKNGDLQTRHNFACQVMMVLSRHLSEFAYDGVMIFAEAPMMEELHGVKTAEVCRALIVEVVGKPFDVSSFPGLDVATAQMANRGAIH